MKLRQIGDFVDNGKVTLFLRRALSSYYFPIATAVISVACYYLGWDIVNIWYLSICGTAIMLCCKDVSPVICIVLFLSLLPSAQHSPRFGGQSSDYLLSPPILAQEIIGVTCFVGSLIFRLVSGVINHRFKITPMFWGIVALSFGFMLSGLFYSHYTALNLVYGLALSAVILGFYIFCCGNINLSDKSFLKIAYYFIALFAAAAVILAVTYLTYDGLVVNGKVFREKLVFGWGTYNQIGLFFTMTIPAWFYLAGRHKYGIFFLLGGLVNLVFAFLSMSRQAMLMGTLIFIACCVWLLLWDKGKKRIINLSVMSGMVVVLLIFTAIFHQKVGTFFSSLLSSITTGSGRLQLWKMGFDNFLSKPIFGVGFYDPDASKGEVGFITGELSSIIPRMCHNTVFQLLSSCGLVGLVTYVVHRTGTVISLINNLTHERVFVFMTMCAILLVSLLDNHIFYFMTTITYAVLISLLSVTEKRGKKSARLAIL